MKPLKEFGGVFLLLTIAQVIWMSIFSVEPDDESMLRVQLASGFRATLGLSVALVFLGHLMPARIGAERIADRAGQGGPGNVVVCALGVLGGVSLTGGWGGPIGMGLAACAVAWTIVGREPPLIFDEDELGE